MLWTPLLTHAREFAAVSHGTQRRKYPDVPYLVHCIAVAKLLHRHGLPEAVVAAGLLHDTVEDTPTTLADIELFFGKEIASLVEMVTDVSKPDDGNRAVRKAIDREHLAKATPDGQSIKLADMIDNTSTIVKYDPAFARIYLPEKEALLPVLSAGHPALLAMAYGELRIAKFELRASGYG